MNNSKISDLVRIAKGDDRTLKEYAEASGVNIAIISKLISGSYTPKKADVYKALTSEQAEPRGEVTFQMMLDAAHDSNEYKEGMLAGLKVAQGFSMLGGAVTAGAIASINRELSDSKQKKRGRKSKGEKVLQETQKFLEASKRIIISQLALQGLPFTVDDTTEFCGVKTLEKLTLQTAENITRCRFQYRYIVKETPREEGSIEESAKIKLSEMIFNETSENELVVIVTNDKRFFDGLEKYKNKLAYRGNLSALLIDIENLVVEDEVYLSHYNYGQKEETILFK